MNNQDNPQDNVHKAAMRNEPKVIYLNCYDEAETDPSYLPIDNDFDTLDGEFVLWSANTPCLGGNIKYVHHSEVDRLQSRIAELEAERDKLAAHNCDNPYGDEIYALEAQNQKYREALEKITNRPEAGAGYMHRIAAEALTRKEGKDGE